MLRILYMLYLWLFVVPVFVVLTDAITALTVIVGCLLGGERIFAYYPGMIWSWLTCHLPLSGEGERTENMWIGRNRTYLLPTIKALSTYSLYMVLAAWSSGWWKPGCCVPFVGAACRAAGFIFVDNSTPKAAARSVLEAERSLKNGASGGGIPGRFTYL